MSVPHGTSRDTIQQPMARPSYLGKIISRINDLYSHLWLSLLRVPYEYQSARKFRCIPLLSINLGPDSASGKMRQAHGVVAIGNKAKGLIAVGTLASWGLIKDALGIFGIGREGRCIFRP